MICQEGQQFFRIQSSPLPAAEIQPGGDRLLRLISPPWAGVMKMLVRDNELVLDAAQMKYVFKKERQRFTLVTV